MSAPAAITVRLVYLARLREAFGSPGEALALEPGVRTVDGVLALLRARGGNWASELAPGRTFRVAVNHALATGVTAVAANDEVAVFPPVTGG